MSTNRNSLMQDMSDSFGEFKRALHYYVSRTAPADYSPAQVELLRVLKQCQPISHKSLAKRLQLTPGAVSQLLDGLDQSGCIERTVSAADRRVVYLSISRHGKQLLDNFVKARRQMLTAACEPLSDQQLQTYITVQQTIITWLDDQPARSRQTKSQQVTQRSRT